MEIMIYISFEELIVAISIELFSLIALLMLKRIFFFFQFSQLSVKCPFRVILIFVIA